MSSLKSSIVVSMRLIVNILKWDVRQKLSKAKFNYRPRLEKIVQKHEGWMPQYRWSVLYYVRDPKHPIHALSFEIPIFNPIWPIRVYPTRTIITRGFYTFYSIFEDPKCFLSSIFHKILTFCSIQERFIIKCWFWWCGYGSLMQKLSFMSL